jgi:hypothetical protein
MTDNAAQQTKNKTLVLWGLVVGIVLVGGGYFYDRTHAAIPKPAPPIAAAPVDAAPGPGTPGRP